MCVVEGCCLFSMLWGQDAVILDSLPCTYVFFTRFNRTTITSNYIYKTNLLSFSSPAKDEKY